MIGPPRKSDPYPFARLDSARDRAKNAGLELIDFGVGDPQDPTPQFIRDTLRDSIPEASSYPKAAGLPQLQAAISEWIQRRYGVNVAPAAIMATLGSKEIIHDLIAYVLDDHRNTVVVPTPAYPVYERGATFHGAELHELPLTSDNAFLPDLDNVPAEVWKRTALLWLNYPNNPTGAVAPMWLYEKAAELSRQYGFVVASDEAYSEIWFEEAPSSVLQLDNLSNIVCINTLSKRSCMTGYRSGFIAGDDSLIGRIRAYRSSTGTTPQEFVQLASVAAWQDEEHVDQLRQLWGEKRDLFTPIFAAENLTVSSEATFFLWVDVPEGQTSDSFAEQLVSIGLIVSPGTVFGPLGEGYIRLALVPEFNRCREAAERLLQFFSRDDGDT